MRIRGYAERTITSYVAHVRQLALYYQRPPDRLNDEQIRTWLHHLIVKRRLSGSTLNIAVNAVRAFLHLVLGRDPAGIAQGVPRGKRAITRALVYAISEVTVLLSAPPARRRDSALLAVTYACGLRLSELVAVRVGDLDSVRGQLRIRRGKRNKPRVVPASAALLELLRDYWRTERSRRPDPADVVAAERWLFVGQRAGQPLHKSAGAADLPACGARGANPAQGRNPHVAAQFRDAHAGGGCRDHAGAAVARAHQPGHHRALPARDRRADRSGGAAAGARRIICSRSRRWARSFAASFSPGSPRSSSAASSPPRATDLP